MYAHLCNNSSNVGLHYINTRTSRDRPRRHRSAPPQPACTTSRAGTSYSTLHYIILYNDIAYHVHYTHLMSIYIYIYIYIYIQARHQPLLRRRRHGPELHRLRRGRLRVRARRSILIVYCSTYCIKHIIIIITLLLLL